eukprot:TRINITY_DN8267_c0_g1_i1.p1 TRINITY_DN8267_c0_g1~~TRINITY_DN8267_c0_g1_i1.p1  ORF type:complete len:3694 (+),score=584.33 TRINITY_DN8267_c0_g1_i1:40-11082(+)
MNVDPALAGNPPQEQEQKVGHDLLIQGNYERWSHLLQTVEMHQKSQMLLEFRARQEVFPSNEKYERFLHICFPILLGLLRGAKIHFDLNPMTTEQVKFRTLLLETIHRLPSTDVLRPFVGELLTYLMAILKDENETDAVVCLRLIIELHKNYRGAPTNPGYPRAVNLEIFVQPFIEFVYNLYREVPETVRRNFDPNNPMPKERIPQALHSFKVLTECPILVVILLRLYPNVDKNIKKFIQPIMDTLAMVVPNPEVNSAAFSDFISAQVKTLSFFAYMAPHVSEFMNQYQKKIPLCLISLLQNCPPDACATRRELLIAIRHIIVSEFRKGCVEHIDTLLNEDLLVGKGRACRDSLRPLAYSSLADLVHQIRHSLSRTQLSKVVYLYSRNIHDPMLPLQVQSMSTKLLMNLVECIEKEQQGRVLLLRIVDTIVRRFSSLQGQLSHLLSQKEIRDENTDLVLSSNAAKDCQQLLSSLVSALKPAVLDIQKIALQQRQAMPQTQIQQSQLSQSSVMEESLIFKRLLRHGLKCLAAYSKAPITHTGEEKELLDKFSEVFTLIDLSIFQDVMSTEIGFLCDCIIENNSLTSVPQNFLGSEVPGIPRLFADIMLHYLISKMGDLSSPNAEVLLRLFKMVFRSVSMFTESDPILRPHLGPIITESMRWASLVKDSANYFYLLKHLFRSISNGKFNEFAKEFLPLLSSLLDGLNILQDSAHPPHLRELFVELSLRIPVRLSALLPCLKLLVKPLVLALEAVGDLCTQGLRVLEVCVDKLGHDYLEPLFGNMKPRLMGALWRHLRPPPYKHAPQVLRIMGKMAGKNRDFFDQPPRLVVTEEIEPNLTVMVTLEPGNEIEVPLQQIINAAHRMLLTDAQKASLFVESWHSEVFSFLKACLLSLLNLDGSIKGVPQQAGEKDDEPPPRFVLYEGTGADKKPVYKTNLNLKSEQYALRKLILSVVLCSAHDDIRADVVSFLDNIAVHFALLYVNKREASFKQLNEIEPSVFVSALVDASTTENQSLCTTVKKALDTILQVATAYCGSKAQMSQLPIFSDLAEQACLCCNRYEWYNKAGGCFLISYLCENLDVEWVRQHEEQFINSLFFITRELSPSVSITTIDEATNALLILIRICHQDPKKENQKHFQEIVDLLVEQLHAPNPRVRQNTHQALQTLAEISKMEVSDLLSKKVVENLLQKISAQPLNELPRVAQTGYLDAITYCVNLRPSIASLDGDLVNLVSSVLQIAKEEEPVAHRQAKVSQMVKRRISIIEFFSSVSSMPEFHGDPKYTELCNDVIAYFFQSLTLRSEAIIVVAKRSLNLIVAQRPMDKGLLKSSLRPIVSNISDHRKLTVPLLEGLERLLHLIRHAFNQNLADKLLSHLRVLSEPEGIEMYSGKSHKHDKAVRIPIAILELFHLLPHTAPGQFLEQLVPVVLKLEANIPQGHFAKVLDSPYRPPLIKFLNSYPVEAVNYFLSRLNELPHRQLFWVVVQSKTAGAVHEELVSKPQVLISSTFRPNLPVDDGAMKTELQFQGIIIVRALLRHVPDLFDRSPELLTCLEEIWNSPDRLTRLQHEASLPLMQLRESKLLAKCFIMHCKRNPDSSAKLIFDMLSILIFPTTIDYTFLRVFYKEYIPSTFTIAQKQLLFTKFMEFLCSAIGNKQYDLATAAIRVIIIPLLTHEMEDGRRKEQPCPLILSALSSIIGMTAPGLLGNEDTILIKDSALNMELLHLARVIISHRLELNDLQKKVLMKFSFHHYKGNESTTQQSAALFLATATAVSGLPPKLAPQLYAHLLKSHQQEAKGLVRDALDQLMPVMASMKQEPPLYVSLIRKIGQEEAFAVPQLVHIIQLIVRKEQYFYAYSTFFLSMMVGALPRLALLPNSTNENRQLALSVVSLILKWETRRKEENAANNPQPQTPTDQSARKGSTRLQNRSRQDEPVQGGVAANVGGGGGPQHQELRPRLIESVLQFVIRIIFHEYKPGEPPGKAERLFVRALTLWPDVDFKIEYVEKLLPRVQPAQQERATLRWVFCTLRVLIIALDLCPPSWVSANTVKIGKLLDITLGRKDEEVMKSPLCMEALTKVVKAHPVDYTGEIFSKVKQCISDVFSLEPVPKQQIITVFSNIIEFKPDFLVEFDAPLAKLIEKMVNEHKDPRQNMLNQKKGIKPDCNELWKFIELFGRLLGRVSYNPRNSFLQSVLVLLQHSTDEEILIKLLKCVNSWFKGELELPVRAEFLKHLKRFQKVRSVELHNTFLELVYMVYEDPKTVAVERRELRSSIFIGLSSRSTELRRKFTEIVDKEVTRNLQHRVCNVILKPDTWNSIGNIYWIPQGLDLIFALAQSSLPLRLVSTSARVPPIGDPEDIEESEPPASIKDLINNYRAFVKTCTVTIGSLVSPLRSLIHNDPKLANDIWVSLFPKIWSEIEEGQRKITNEALPNFLACLTFVKQSRATPNIIQSLLAGFKNCKAPASLELAPPIINYCAKNFNSWYLGIRMLEDIYAARANNDMNSVFINLNSLYRTLTEEDFYHGMCYLHSVVEDSKSALIFEQMCLWQKAHEVLTIVQKDVSEGLLLDAPVQEQEMWRAHWEDCCRRLNYWELLCEFAKANKRIDVLVQTCWKIGEWDLMKETFRGNSFQTESPQIRIFQTFICLQENRIVEVDQLCKKAMSFLVHQWVGWPSIPSMAHMQMLQSFQKIIELYESAKIMKDIRDPSVSSSNKTSEVAHILKVWRQRLPNQWDDIYHWSDLLRWRQHVFSLITEAYKSDPQADKSVGAQETAWSIHKFAQIARYQGLPELCLSTLKEVDDLPNLKNDQLVYGILKEQLLCYLDMPRFYRVGLKIINKVNIDSFQPTQKAELFQLKGEFLSLMGYHEASEKAYATALFYCKELDKAWIGWAKYWDLQAQLYSTLEPKKALEFTRNAINCYLQGVKCNNHETRSSLTRVLWLTTTSSIVEGFVEKMDEEEEHPSKKRKVDKETNTAQEEDQAEEAMECEEILEEQSIQSLFATHTEAMLEWVWLTWIPELLAKLSQDNGKAYKAILCRIATKFPQAIFYSLNNFIQTESIVLASKPKKRGGRRKAAPPSPVQPEPSEGLKLAREVMDHLKQSHPSLYMNLTQFTKAIEAAFVPTREEDLLKLLEEVLVQTYTITNTYIQRDRIWAYLKSIYELTFVITNDGELVESKTNEFDKKYKAIFSKEFATDTPDQLDTSTLVDRLKWFITELRKEPGNRANKIPLGNLSRYLAEFQSDQVEVPGQYPENKEPSSDDHHLIDKFHSPVRIMSHGLPRSYISLRTNTGDNLHFLIESCHRTPTIPFSSLPDIEEVVHQSSLEDILTPATNVSWESELRFSRLLRYFNVLLKEKNAQSKKRQIYLPASTIVPMSPNMRMIWAHSEVVSHSDICNNWCDSQGIDRHEPLMAYQGSYFQALDEDPSLIENDTSLLQLRRGIFNHIKSNIVPPHIFTDYIYSRLLEDHDSAWHFKKHFTSQLAITSLISYIFSVDKRSQYNSAFCPSSAQIYMSKLNPCYTQSGVLLLPQVYGSNEIPPDELQENIDAYERTPVPFIVPSNVQHFIGPVGLTGLFNTVSLASVLTLGKVDVLEDIRDHLLLFFEGELTDWSSRNRNSKKLPQVQPNTKEFIKLVERNSNIVAHKLSVLTPDVSADAPVDPAVPINHQVSLLLEAASSTNSLCQVDPAYAPWF